MVELWEVSKVEGGKEGESWNEGIPAEGTPGAGAGAARMAVGLGN